MKKIILFFAFLLATGLISIRAQDTWVQKSDLGHNTINVPAGSHIHGLLVRIDMDCAPLSILPRLVCGGCIPIPKKLSAASSSIEIATTDVAYTKTGAIVFGKISENKI